eukprot:5235109-Amphidinium_carterae.1
MQAALTLQAFMQKSNAQSNKTELVHTRMSPSLLVHPHAHISPTVKPSCLNVLPFCLSLVVIDSSAHSLGQACRSHQRSYHTDGYCGNSYDRRHIEHSWSNAIMGGYTLMARVLGELTLSPMTRVHGPSALLQPCR